MQSTHVLKWPVVKYKHIKIKPRICVLFILCLAWTVNANSLKQNIIVIKEIYSWLPPFCKQNLLLFIQPRWRLRKTYFLNHYKPIWIKFCMVVDIPDRSHLQRFWTPSVKGFLSGGGPFFPFPIVALIALSHCRASVWCTRLVSETINTVSPRPKMSC